MNIKRLLESIFSVKNEYSKTKRYKVVTILGIKIKRCANVCNLDIKKHVPIDKYIEKENITLYKNHYERYWMDFSKETLPENLVEKYSALTKGLDIDSVDLIDRIIYRWNVIKEHLYDEYIDIFTEKEKKEILTQYDNFDSKIYQLEPNKWKHGKYILPVNCSGDVFYFKHRLDLLSNNSIERLKNSAIIDAGAFVGDSACIFSEFVEDGTIYSFEPVQENYEMLISTIKMNDLKKVVPIKKALGDKIEKLDINVHDSGSTILQTNREGMTIQQIQSTTLDKFVEENNLTVGLIKTDVEGFEPQLLEGAKNTIKTQRPVLLISIYHNMHDLFEIKPMIESWNLGYSFKIVKCNSYKFLQETMLIAEPV